MASSPARQPRRDRPAAERPPLSAERIVDAALGLADREGLEAVSMRRVGRELGVEAMSLYHHVADKDALLDALVDRVLSEIDVPVPGDGAWREAMRRRAVSARAAFGRHPWALGLLEQRYEGSSARRLGYFDGVLGTFRAAGFSNQLAMRAFAVLDAYVYGAILQQLSLPFDDDAGLQDVGADLLRQLAEQYPHLTAVTREVLADGYDADEEFGFGLELVLDALERRHRAEGEGGRDRAPIASPGR